MGRGPAAFPRSRFSASCRASCTGASCKSGCATRPGWGRRRRRPFYYGQNIVVRALTNGAPPLDGIVEECYPIAALTDHLVYWRANGSEETFRANLKREMDNVARFIDADSTTVFVTSQYRFGGWTDLPPPG